MAAVPAVPQFLGQRFLIGLGLADRCLTGHAKALDLIFDAGTFDELLGNAKGFGVDHQRGPMITPGETAIPRLISI